MTHQPYSYPPVLGGNLFDEWDNEHVRDLRGWLEDDMPDIYRIIVRDYKRALEMPYATADWKAPSPAAMEVNNALRDISANLKLVEDILAAPATHRARALDEEIAPFLIGASSEAAEPIGFEKIKERDAERTVANKIRVRFTIPQALLAGLTRDVKTCFGQLQRAEGLETAVPAECERMIDMHIVPLAGDLADEVGKIRALMAPDPEKNDERALPYYATCRDVLLARIEDDCRLVMHKAPGLTSRASDRKAMVATEVKGAAMGEGAQVLDFAAIREQWGRRK